MVVERVVDAARPERLCGWLSAGQAVNFTGWTIS